MTSRGHGPCGQWPRAVPKADAAHSRGASFPLSGDLGRTRTVAPGLPVAASGWAPVREAVVRIEAVQGGALAVAAFHRGRPVVDLWAGTASPDTLFHTWSAIEPVTGTCLLLLGERGRLRLDDRVAGSWPELDAVQPGLAVRHLLSHSAGLIRVPAPGTAATLLD